MDWEKAFRDLDRAAFLALDEHKPYPNSYIRFMEFMNAARIAACNRWPGGGWAYRHANRGLLARALTNCRVELARLVLERG